MCGVTGELKFEPLQEIVWITDTSGGILSLSLTAIRAAWHAVTLQESSGSCKADLRLEYRVEFREHFDSLTISESRAKCWQGTPGPAMLLFSSRPDLFMLFCDVDDR